MTTATVLEDIKIEHNIPSPSAETRQGKWKVLIAHMKRGDSVGLDTQSQVNALLHSFRRCHLKAESTSRRGHFRVWRKN